MPPAGPIPENERAPEDPEEIIEEQIDEGKPTTAEVPNREAVDPLSKDSL